MGIIPKTNRKNEQIFIKHEESNLLMVKEAIRCTSCGKRVEAEKAWVEFMCPKCGKAKIIRCEKCKRMVNTYECPKCGFVGP